LRAAGSAIHDVEMTADRPSNEADTQRHTPADLRVALVHYWLVSARGGEAVLEGIGRLFPAADLYAHVIDPSVPYGSLAKMRARTTFIAKLPAARRLYPAYLGLMPTALEALDLSSYDLVISSEAGPAKWVLPAPGAKHVCYCHSPMRYVWDQRFTYLDRIPAPIRPLAHLAGHSLRQSDFISASRVTQFVANSRFVANRIEQYYRRESEIIYPPVDVDDFVTGEPEDFYLCAGEVRHYKRIDLAIQACERLGRRLIIAGGGNARRLKAMAGRHVEFTGRLDTEAMRSLMRRCRALIFPGVEDFGIVPVEVMASGRPVIAYAYGGALDSVVPGVSGVLFGRQTVDGLVSAILEFENSETALAQEEIRKHARTFSRAEFEAKFSALIRRVANA
jgi:glycosyltransferase involved in cell wall biosynthesis